MTSYLEPVVELPAGQLNYTTEALQYLVKLNDIINEQNSSTQTPYI